MEEKGNVSRDFWAGLRRETIPIKNHGQQSLAPPCRGSIWSYIIFSFACQILWVGKAEKEDLTWPLMATYGTKFRVSEHSFFKGGAGYLMLVLHLTSFLATGGA